MPAVGQSGFTVVAEVPLDKVQALKDYLHPIGYDIKGNGIVDFSSFHKLHFCCFVVIDDHKRNPGAAPVLVFEGNVDGGTADFLREMADHPFLTAVFAHCRDAPAERDLLVQYLLERDLGYNAYYISHPGRTVKDKIDEACLMTALQGYLDQNYQHLGGLAPAAVRAELQTQFGPGTRFAWARTPHDDLLRVRLWRGVGQRLWPWATAALLAALAYVSWRHLATVGLVMIGVLVLAASYVARLRSLESSDVQDPDLWESGHAAHARSIEDRQTQNHLTSLSYVKPGPFRLWTLRAILGGINLAARYTQVNGNLTGIVTIHFARWVILDGGIDGGKRLLFLSNYDGSWEKYLGEFIDVASRGLSAIWSNTGLGPQRGFPNTTFLYRTGGARDEQRFKAMARNSQHPEQIWYSAYPELSVINVSNNKAVREGLYGAVPSAQDWLTRF